MERDRPPEESDPTPGDDVPDGDGAECDADHGNSSVTRRGYLKLAGTAALSSAIAGCESESSTQTTTAATETRTTQSSGVGASGGPTDVVDAGADNSGKKPINRVLKRIHGDDATIHFPPGTYRLEPITLAGSGWTVTGEDATLVVPGSVNRDYLDIRGSDWTFEGFTIDLTADGAAPANYLLGTNWQFTDVDFVGQMSDPQYRGESDLMYPAVTSTDATGLIENVSAMDGSADPGESSNRGLTWFGPNNKGKMIWRGCEFSGWANNTLYASESTGPVLIEECLFKNTNVGVRIGGNTVVRNCLWLQTGRVPSQRWTGDSNGRGLWLSSNGHVPGAIEIVGCDFVMTGADATSAINASHRSDEVTIRDSRIRQSYNQSAIELPGDGPVTIRNVSIMGSLTEWAVDFWNRDGSVVTGCCINVPGNGIRISNSDNCRVENTTVDVGGNAFKFNKNDVPTTDISKSGRCPAPDRSNPAADG